MSVRSRGPGENDMDPTRDAAVEKGAGWEERHLGNDTLRSNENGKPKKRSEFESGPDRQLLRWLQVCGRLVCRPR